MRKEKGAILFAMIPLFAILMISAGVYVFNSKSKPVINYDEDSWNYMDTNYTNSFDFDDDYDDDDTEFDF